MRSYVRLSGVIFGLVALGHLVRTIRRWPLLIAGEAIPAAAVRLRRFLEKGRHGDMHWMAGERRQSVLALWPEARFMCGALMSSPTIFKA